MYKFIVVTDPDTAPGFRLAGVDVMEVPAGEDAGKIIAPLLYRDDTGIVAVNEEYMGILDEKLIEKMDRMSYIERLLQRAIGYNIVLRR
jgi:V/A-type H+-transporting ATPase subunit F